MHYQGLKVASMLLWATTANCIDINTQITPQDTKMVQDHYQRYLTVSGQQTRGMDVHAFNRTINMRQVLADLYRFDDQYIRSQKDSDSEILLESILWSMEFEDLPPQAQQSVRQNINTLKNHLNSNPIEASETGANVNELLSRIWYLSNFKEIRSDSNLFCTSSAARHFLLHALRENSETGGGCFPGFAGRLGSLYLMLINSWIIK